MNDRVSIYDKYTFLIDKPELFLKWLSVSPTGDTAKIY